jgi:hypothetical protein
MSNNTLGDFMERKLTDKEGSMFIKIIGLLEEIEEDSDTTELMSEKLDNLVHNAKLMNRLWKEAHVAE